MLKDGLSAPTIKSISVDAGRLSEADTENTLLTLRDDAYPLSPKFDPSSSSIDWGVSARLMDSRKRRDKPCGKRSQRRLTSSKNK